MRFLIRGRFPMRPDSQETMFRTHHVLSAAARRCDITDLVWAGGSGAKCWLVQMALPSVSWKHHIPKLTFSGFSLQDYLSHTQISLHWPHTCHHTNTFFSPISDFTCVNKDISSMTTNHFLTIRQICFPLALHREIPKCTHVFPTILALYTFDDTHTPILTTRREAAGENTQKRIEFFFVSTKM